MPVIFGSNSWNCDLSFRRVALLAAIAAGVWVSSGASADEVYRYEKDGKVTYGDYVPPSGLGAGHSVLNSQGVMLKQIKSREERREARRLEREAKAQQIADRTLLRTFTTEEDLIRTRDDRLGIVDGQIDRLDERIRISKDSLGINHRRIRDVERSKGEGEAPQEWYAEQERTKKRIENAWSLIDAKAAERKKIVTKFEEDLIRYRWLKNGGAR